MPIRYQCCWDYWHYLINLILTNEFVWCSSNFVHHKWNRKRHENVSVVNLRIFFELLLFYFWRKYQAESHTSKQFTTQTVILAIKAKSFFLNELWSLMLSKFFKIINSLKYLLWANCQMINAMTEFWPLIPKLIIFPRRISGYVCTECLQSKTI